MKNFQFEFNATFEDIEFIKPLKVRNKIITKNTFLKVKYKQSYLSLSTLHEINPHFHQRSLVEIKRALLDFFSQYSLQFENIRWDLPFFNCINNLQKKIEERFFEAEFLYHIEVLILFLIKENYPNLINHTFIKKNDVASSLNPFDRFLSSECLKFKITPQTLREDIIFINSLIEQNDQCLWRFDGNRQWSLDQLISFCQQIPKNIKIDYFEDPFINFSDRYLFEKRYDYLLAIDENFEVFFPNLGCFNQSPLVVKPSLLGISNIYRWLNQNPDYRVIISSSYEHPSAMIGLELLAALKPCEFHGLSAAVKNS